MEFYESEQVKQWRMEYSDLREKFGTDLTEFEYVARQAVRQSNLDLILRALGIEADQEHQVGAKNTDTK